MNLSKLKPWAGLKSLARADGELDCFISVFYAIPNGGGLPYETNEIEIGVGEDGHISFSADSAESHIYFYPQQIKHLRRAMALLSKSKPKGEK